MYKASHAYRTVSLVHRLRNYKARNLADSFDGVGAHGGFEPHEHAYPEALQSASGESKCSSWEIDLHDEPHYEVQNIDVARQS